jgi:Putative collagen-binding domain of a collagenase
MRQSLPKDSRFYIVLCTFHIVKLRILSMSAMPPTPGGEAFTLKKSIIKCARVKEIWYDLRYGVSYLIHQSDQWGIQTYTPPTNGRGNDWIFLLEDADAGYLLSGPQH